MQPTPERSHQPQQRPTVVTELPSIIAPIAPGHKDGWRRTSTRYFMMICTFMLLVTYSVHKYTLVLDESSLPIAQLVEELQARYCSPEVQRTFEENPPRLTRSGRLMGEDEGGRLPLPSNYGIGVWADNASLIPGARRIIAEIDRRLAAPPEAPRSAASDERELRYMFPFYRLQSLLVEEFRRSHTTPMTNEAEALKHVGELAEEQQLGMTSLRHVFTPDLKKETYMLGLSFFSLPASLLPFIPNPEERPTWCHSFDVRQSFCVFLTRDDGSYYAPGGLEKEVEAAVSSVLAYDMRIDGFHPNDVERWHSIRHLKGCIYAVQSLRTLLDSIEGNPDMRIPFAIHNNFERLERIVKEGSMIMAARAADDLQFEPLLTPQLYMPLDHSVLSQLLILLPVISMFLLSFRFLLEEKRLDRKRGKLLAMREATLAMMAKKQE